MQVDHISDTAQWVAAFRAMESERRDAHFHDPLARPLAGERGFELAQGLPGGHTVGWVMAVRTTVIDQAIYRAIQSGTTRVVNLACGLDTRPYRLDLPKELSWVEVDLPGILDLKESVLATLPREQTQPRCQLERVRLDLADRDARRADHKARIHNLTMYS